MSKRTYTDNRPCIQFNMAYSFFIIFCVFVPQSLGFWFLSDLPVGMLSGASPTPCETIPGLLKGQRHLCLEQPEVMLTIGEGVRGGIEECQNQFKDQRWNCTTIQKEDHDGKGKLALKVGSREGAFVHAISSAGVVHAITRGCSSGDLSNCACDKKVTPRGRAQSDTRGLFTWTGCSNNVRYAVRFARKFIDAVEKQKHESGEDSLSDGRALINLHNNRVGRKLVQDNLIKECKCHGVSGSCAARTCWMSIGSLRKTGELLRRKYDQAKKVKVASDGMKIVLTETGKDNPQRTDLVFYESSPDYCASNHLTGSLGTGGRVCKANSTGADNCDIMCCGRGYDTRRVEKVEKCHCKFQWCCHVDCQTCTEVSEEQVCKPDSGSRKFTYERLRERSRPSRKLTSDKHRLLPLLGQMSGVSRSETLRTDTISPVKINNNASFLSDKVDLVRTR